MAWTAPRTWVTGETITTVIMNQHIRDNLLALLTVPVAKMQRTAGAGTSIPNTGVETLVVLDTSILDTDSMVDIANNRLNVNTAGKYIIGGLVSYTSTADTTGYRAGKIRHTRSGTPTIIAEWRGISAAPGNTVARVCSTIYDCLVGDQLQLVGAQTSGTGAVLTFPTSYFQPSLYAFRIGT